MFWFTAQKSYTNSAKTQQILMSSSGYINEERNAEKEKNKIGKAKMNIMRGF